MKLEVVVLPVAGVDRADTLQGVGGVDADFAGSGFPVAQVTPPAHRVPSPSAPVSPPPPSAPRQGFNVS
jgi:hypothetical protein